MIWNKSGFSSKGKDRMRARNQPNFKKSLQWRHSVTMVRRSSRNRCNDLLPSIFPALGFHLFARVCAPFVTTCVSGNRRSLVGCIRPHCFHLPSHLQTACTSQTSFGPLGRQHAFASTKTPVDGRAKSDGQSIGICTHVPVEAVS
jgi:hypothetical protein